MIATAGSLCLIVAVRAVGAEMALPNSGFEQSLSGWGTDGDNGMSVAVAEAAHSGSLGLRVTDHSPTLGSSLLTQKVAVEAGKTYQVRFWARLVEGQGSGVYLRFVDKDGKVLNTDVLKNENIIQLPAEAKDWKEYSLKGTAPADAANVQIWIHAFSAAQSVADYDDFSLEGVDS